MQASPLTLSSSSQFNNQKIVFRLRHSVICFPYSQQDVKPGKARVVKCLIENMAQPNFGEDCKEELQQRDEIMKSDVRCVLPVSRHGWLLFGGQAACA